MGRFREEKERKNKWGLQQCFQFFDQMNDGWTKTVDRKYYAVGILQHRNKHTFAARISIYLNNLYTEMAFARQSLSVTLLRPVVVSSLLSKLFCPYFIWLGMSFRVNIAEFMGMILILSECYILSTIQCTANETIIFAQKFLQLDYGLDDSKLSKTKKQTAWMNRFKYILFFSVRICGKMNVIN